MAFDPHPNLRDLIARFHEADAVRPPDRPIRLHRAVVMSAEDWRFNVHKNERARGHQRPSTTSIAARTHRLAVIGDILAVPTGSVVESLDVRP
jgi:hypothetical protein